MTSREVSMLLRSLLLVFGMSCLTLPSSQAEDRGASEMVDAQINAALVANKQTPAPRADDAEIVRRLYLDVLGRIPTRIEVETYLADPSKDKHHQLIDRLLAHEEMPIYWAAVIDDWLCSTALERDFGRDAFLVYLENALRERRPWNEVARELIAADVSQESQRPAAYYLAIRLRGDNAEKLDNITSAVASNLLGIQLQCAKCHDHPFVEEIHQDHYYGLAAFFGRTQEARYQESPIVREKAEGEVTFVTQSKEERKASLLFLDGTLVQEPDRPTDKNAWYSKAGDGLPEVPYFNRRQALADLVMKAESPYFKRAMVNRVWKQLLGRGLVEPVDQMHAANAASHPELLTRLADDFAAQKFDLHRVLKSILHSEVYLRSSRWTASTERPSDTQYAVAQLKPLNPHQLTTSMALATGSLTQYQNRLEQDKAKRKLSEITPAVVRRLFVRERETQEFATRFRTAGESFDMSASHALFLSYHPLVSKQLKPSEGNLVDRLVKNNDPDSAAEDALLSVLGRQPTDADRAQYVKLLGNSALTRTQQCQEFVRALLCSAEFRFNH